MNADPPEQLLDVFKAAALSVTKLYRASAAAQTKARLDGYQDCLEDLLSFLDKGSIGLADGGEGWRVRQWANERRANESTSDQALESEEDDADNKADAAPSPVMPRATLATAPVFPAPGGPPVLRTDSAPPPTTHPISTPPPILAPSTTSIPTVPTQDTFNFQSTIQYPQEPNLNLAGLDLSDSRPHDGAQHQIQVSQTVTGSRVPRGRHGSNAGRPGARAANRLGRGAGQKRRLGDELGDVFNVGSLGYSPKDFFGGGKRTRHN